MNILDIVAKYWIEFAFGLVASGITTGATFVWKRLKKINQDRWNNIRKEMSKEMERLLTEREERVLEVISNEKEASKTADAMIREEVHTVQDNLHHLTEGVLSIQGHQFKEECRRLLEHDHKITLEEFEHLCNEHRIYNSLGGNHHGDNLFKLVETKYHANLHKIV